MTNDTGRYVRNGALFALVLVLVLLGGCPPYKMWARQMEGEGERLHAEQVRQTLVIQARAELEAAQLRSQAIETIGQMASKYPEYRAQEFLGALGEALQSGKIAQIVYLPTEAGIPITEATRVLREPERTPAAEPDTKH